MVDMGAINSMDQILKVIKALSDRNRLKIIELLLEQCFCVRALSKSFKVSEPAVSQHLKVLRLAGIIKGKKKDTGLIIL